MIGVPVADYSPPAFVQLDGVMVSEVASLLVRDVLREPYILTPEVAADKRLVSVRIQTDGSRPLRGEVLGYLSSLGVASSDAAGSIVLSKGSPAYGQNRSYGETPFLHSARSNAGFAQPVEPASWPSPALPSWSPLPAQRREDRGPLQSPQAALVAPGVVSLPDMAQSGPVAPPEPAARQLGVYRPRFRDAAYLASLLGAALPGLSVGRGLGEGSAASVSIDVLILSGSHADVGRALELLPQLDVEQDQVALVAAVYEVSTGSSSASALSIALSLFGARLGITTPTTPIEALVKLSTRDVGAVFGVLAGDSRFRAVTSPSLLVRSGSEATLTSGSQVPVLGSVSYPGEGGAPVQSVEYRDSGVVLRVKPMVHGETIDLDIAQELSSFVRTETGVNSTPTLNRRALTNRLTVRSGEIVVLGGLKESRSEAANSGLLRGWLGSRSRATRDTEIIVVLQANRLKGARTRSEARTHAPEAGSVSVP